MTEIDTLEVRKQWLNLCPSCDAGMPGSCTCPKERPQVVVGRLCDEIDQLNKELRDARTHRLSIAIAAQKWEHCPKPFALYREQDETGVSGTGVVAYGVVFSDETCVIRWQGETPSMVVWDSLAAAMKVHGHNGKTWVVWLTETWDNAVKIEEELEKLREEHAQQSRVLDSIRQQRDNFQELAFERNATIARLRQLNAERDENTNAEYNKVVKERDKLRSLTDCLRAERDRYMELATERNAEINKYREANDKMSADNYNLRMENRDLSRQVQAFYDSVNPLIEKPGGE